MFLFIYLFYVLLLAAHGDILFLHFSPASLALKGSLS